MPEAAARIHTDGAARGNPGPAAWAYIIEPPGGAPIEAAKAFGTATNNVAEYLALVRALEHAARLKLRRLAVFSDSELMVKQLRGEYAVKNADLRGLYDEVQALCRNFTEVVLTHIRREANKRTDALCNAVLDTQAGKPPKKAATRRKTVARRADVDDRAIECLRTVLGDNGAAAAVLWDQLWSILEEAGALKPGRKS